MARRIATLAYGVVAYAAFLAVVAYTVGFLADAVVPKGIDDGTAGPVWFAVIVDLALLGVFAVQHTVMARPPFKRAWTRVVPPAIERSTFVLAASLAIGLLLWQWRPLTGTVWSASPGWLRALLWTVYALGWAFLIFSTFPLGHFDQFGLRQVLARARNREYVEPAFGEPLFYKVVRHPIMIGFLVTFWVTPDMTVGHLLFAAASTGYIVVGVRLEEHDLRPHLGEPYERYLERVPRFIPMPRAGNRSATVPDRRTG